MEPTPQSESTVASLAIPIAIVAGFGLIALAIYFSGMGNSSAPTGESVAKDAPQQKAPITKDDIRPVDSNDFIKGNPNAQILIVEYSDYDCPFCKSFHETMTRVMNEYGIGGKVAWVYRQFPIAQLHPNAERISLTALCVGKLGGNDAFWNFSDLVFNERGTNEPTNISKLPEYAEKVGVNKETLVACLESGEQDTVLAQSLNDGVKAGISGTPQSFVIVGNQIAPIEGAQPYTVVKSIIDNLLGQLEGGAEQPAENKGRTADDAE